MVARHLTTHSTGLAIMQPFIINANRSPVNSGVRLLAVQFSSKPKHCLCSTSMRYFLAGGKALMASWLWFAIAAAVLYGLHQVFTKLAAEHIGDGLGGFVVEATAALTIVLYLGYLKFFGEWRQPATGRGVFYSILTGLCVGAGTVAFFLLFQKGGPLSAVPIVLAGGAALMAVAGILFFKEPASLVRIVGIVLSLVGLFLLRYTPAK
jgi:bacterial/archaeal transporter family protein